MRTLALLVVNAGSSSVKFAVFAYPPHGDPERRPLHEGEATGVGNSVSIRFDAEPDGALPLVAGDPYRAVLARIATWVREQLPHIAPRIVLGIALDPGANAAHAHVVSSASSAVTVVVEPANEAWAAARAAVRVLRGNRDA